MGAWIFGWDRLNKGGVHAFVATLVALGGQVYLPFGFS